MFKKNSNMRNLSQVKIFNSFFIMLIIAGFCTLLAGQGLTAGLTVYVNVMGSTASYAGLLGLVFSIAAAAARLFVGMVLERTFTLRVTIIGLISLLFFTVLLLLFAKPGPVFTILRAFQGLSFAVATTSCAVAAEEVLPAERLGEGIGYYGLAQAIALALGPALGLVLAQSSPASNLFLGVSFSMALSILIISFCRYDKHPNRLPMSAAYIKKTAKQQACIESEESVNEKYEETYKGVAKLFEARALPGAIGIFLFAVSNSFFMMFSGQYGVELNVSNPGIMFTLAAATMIGTRLCSRMYMDIIEPRYIMTVAAIFGILGFVCFFGALSIKPLFYVAGLLYGIAFGVISPLCQSVSVKNCPHSRWGAATALYYLGLDVGMGIGAVIVGVLRDAFGYSSVFIYAFAMYTVLIFVTWVVFPKNNAD